MAYSSISIESKPDKVYKCTPAEFKISAKLNQSVDWPNFAIAIWYDSGPTDTIWVIDDTGKYELGKGEGTPKIFDTTVGVTRTLNIGLHFTEAGTYRIRFTSGYLYLGVIHVDDEVSTTVTVEEAAPTPTPTPKLAIGTRELTSITASLITLGASLLALPRDKSWVAAPVAAGTAIATYMLYPKISEAITKKTE